MPVILAPADWPARLGEVSATDANLKARLRPFARPRSSVTRIGLKYVTPLIDLVAPCTRSGLLLEGN
jgi:hypothetical protein